MSRHSSVSFRPLGPDDIATVQWTLYTAVSWNDPPGLPPLEVALQHPEMLRYHTGWGRTGDIGVAASVDTEFLGAAFARLFTDDDHGHGYIDTETPELGIAVEQAHRGHGVGRLLMNELAVEAKENGFARLSLSVNNPNPAKRLYEAIGYRLVEDDGDSSLMVLEL